MMETKKSINFTVVPDESQPVERVYANFCAVSHTPFDFTLSFCEMQPLSERDLVKAPEGSTHIVKAPVKLKVVVPANLIPALVGALNENLRIYQDAYSNVGWAKHRLH